MESENELDTRQLVQEQNRKKKKSGGFQSMGLSQAVFKGIFKKGYKVPTPIQRKCIPIILEGRDVVAMARTGSGKTAAFLLPLFERLKTRIAKSGARALILAPTRELALQTFKFTKELGKFTGLRATLVLGGDRMEDQFAAIHENPDIIIATPGRFLHVVMEMELKLSSVEYIVFDEADRLFEMGFAEQLQEILQRLPDSRQTLLFSATLPKILADFAKAGLNDPILIRLDVETKLSDQLKLGYLSCRSEDKISVLLYLLRTVIPEDQLTVVFVATKHHVEYLNMILTQAGINCAYLYSSLDHAARKINVAKFQSKKATVLLVTDIAARGIDIPMLDNVINFSFPAKSKLFVHRVGRVARAGRSGTSFCLISPDEAPFVLDLHLFLGQPIKYAKSGENVKDWNGLFGTVPRSIVDEEEEQILSWHKQLIDLANMKKVCNNAYKLYLKSRPNPSAESVRRMKEEFQVHKMGIHPLFGPNVQNDASDILQQMKSYKPHTTIFEVNSTSKTQASAVVRKIRQKYSVAMTRHHQKLEEKVEQAKLSAPSMELDTNNYQDENVEEGFSSVVSSKKRRSEKMFEPKPKKRKKMEVATRSAKPSEHYIDYKPSNHYSERGLEVEKNTFQQQAANEVLDLVGDDIVTMKRRDNQQKWDRKKKKFVNVSGKDTNKKKIKTESGVWIPATYKSDIYKKWKHRNKVEAREAAENESENEGNTNAPRRGFHIKKQNKNAPKNKHQPPKRELRNKEEIVKQRKRKDRIQFQQKRRQLERSNSRRKSQHQKSGKRKK